MAKQKKQGKVSNNMAKYCGHCGTKLDDNAKVCGNCGTPLESTSDKIPGVKIVDPEKQRKTKKTIKMIIGLIAVVAIVVVAISVVSNFTGSKGLLRKVMSAYKNYDIDSLVSMSSDMYYYGYDDFAEYYFTYSVGENLDAFEVSVGHSYTLSYEVKEIYTMSERKFSELISNIENMYTNFDSSIIKKVAVADLTLTAKQGSKSTKRDLQVTMTKEDDGWKLLYID